MSAKKLVLVDGSYYLFRAFHALPPLTSSSGEPTGAIFGVMGMLKKLLAEQRPDYFAVVFDPKGDTFRNELYPAYKANRPPIDPELACQIGPLQEIIAALGVPLLVIDGVEADDVLATLARRAAERGVETVISSGDKDLAQIVNDRIRLINTMTGVVLDPDGVKEKYGVTPAQIVDYLTLVGDTVDNVPGVPKVGPKTAAKWLAEYGSLESVLTNAHNIKGKIGEYLRAAIPHLPLTRQLVTLKMDVDLPLEPEDLVRAPPDVARLQPLLERYELRGWSEAATTPAPQPQVPGPLAAVSVPAYETVLDATQLAAWVERLKTAELIAVDTETTGLDPMTARLVGISFTDRAGAAAYVPVGHDYPGAQNQLPLSRALDLLRPVLEAEQPAKLGHNIKYDLSVFAMHGINLAGIRHDSMLESYVIDSTGSRHDMDSLAEQRLRRKTIHYEDVTGKGARQISFSQVAIDVATAYAAEDAEVTLALHQNMWPVLQSTAGLREVYEQLEMPLVPVLSRMERCGVKVDAHMLRQQGHELAQRMGELEEQAYAVAGQRFNIASPKQIREILYEKMNLPVTEKTGTGQPSTAESALQDLADEYELPRLILDHRALSKLKSTYTDRLPQQVNEDTGRVHTSYHQAVAATGRLSSSDPNLQNIPIRTAEGRRIRQAFVAGPGNVLVAADYSQIELRIMAHLSGDARLLQAFAAGEDVHRLTAAEVFNVALDLVTPEQRRAAKAINFGLIYGMSPFGLARQLGIERSAAREYVDLYFQRYPAVREFMDRTRREAHDRGYVETVFRRRLYLPDINARDNARRQYAERTAINAPMQGTAADIIKRAMIAIDTMLPDRFPEAHMIMQVHDELVFEVPEPGAEALCAAVAEIMSGAARLSVPLAVDTGKGKNWDEAH
ncbi:MAG: DNA polymerase I [Gammaproteobacteria bacterium RIFCSPLOWO2_02_FULL_61_13]|nr:MAG: DNA polymerase I [Gammaproteobacteria bacterium RIFCSPLOWO2_02_FULL_61_13]